MKKLFAGIFATVLGLGCLTACGEDNKDVVYNVDAAADFLDATYVDQIVDGRVDYDLLNAITYSGATYTVEWSVDVTEGVVLVNNGTETKVDVDEAAAADMDYVLTATVKDPNGATATVKFYATLLKAPSLVPFAITEKPVEGTAYKLYAYNSFGKFDMYFNGQIASKFYLGSVEDYEQSVDVYVEYVEGSDTLFNLYFNDETAGKQYFGIRQNWNSTKSYWSYNPYIEAAPVSQFEYSADYQTIITTVPASSEDVESAPLDTTKTIYWGNSSTASKTYSTIGGLEIADWGGEDGGLPAALVTLGSPAGVSAEAKFAFEKEAISFADSFVGANTVSVGLVGKRYYDVKIAWEVVEGDCITFDDGIFTITNPAAETSVTVKATITLGELTETLTFTATVKPAVVVPEANSTLTIPEANELGNKFEKDKYTEGKYYVTGKIKSITNTQYGNLYIEDEAGNEFYVYGLNDEYGNKFEAMDPQPKVGDTITAYGQIGKYNSAQMKNAQMTAYTPGEGGEDVGGSETPNLPAFDTEITIEKALEIANTFTKDNYTEGKYYIIATVKAVTSTEHGNMTVTDGTNDLTVYGTWDSTGENKYGAMTEGKPVVGDTVKLYGILGMYYAPQMKNAWIMEVTPSEAPAAELPKADTSYYLCADGKANSYIQGKSSNGEYLVVGAKETAITVTFEAVDGVENGYYIKLSTGEYVNAKSSGNKLAFSTTASTVWVVDTATLCIKQNNSSDGYCIQYNGTSGQERISRYKGTQTNAWFEEVIA
ncbi:MAG: hypothetical protein J6K86_00960 [Clostridia bacterium]|nr:hypothetical protein [Clostridia bacterium]MBP3422313.1 hypothetical protein [Clostridia bacterium]